MHFNYSFSSSGDTTYKCKVDNEEFNTSEVIKTLDSIQPKALHGEAPLCPMSNSLPFYIPFLTDNVSLSYTFYLRMIPLLPTFVRALISSLFGIKLMMIYYYGKKLKLKNDTSVRYGIVCLDGCKLISLRNSALFYYLTINIF